MERNSLTNSFLYILAWIRYQTSLTRKNCGTVVVKLTSWSHNDVLLLLYAYKTEIERWCRPLVCNRGSTHEGRVHVSLCYPHIQFYECTSVIEHMIVASIAKADWFSNTMMAFEACRWFQFHYDSITYMHGMYLTTPNSADFWWAVTTLY